MTKGEVPDWGGTILSVILSGSVTMGLGIAPFSFCFLTITGRDKRSDKV